MKQKSIIDLEQRMANVNGDSFRYHVLETAKGFKTSWVELGRALYSVYTDKMYKEWGYQTFDGYVVKEVGIRKQTSLKLLRSYYFLEKDEPGYLKEQYAGSKNVAALPSYESIDVLRRAKGNKEIDKHDYVQLRKNIFEKGKDVADVRKDLTALMRQRKEVEPEEAWAQKKEKNVKRLLTTLRSLKREVEDLKIVPAAVITDLAKLIERLDAQLR